MEEVEVSAARRDSGRQDRGRQDEGTARRPAGRRPRAHRGVMAVGAIVVIAAVALALVLFHESGGVSPAAVSGQDAGPAGPAASGIAGQVTSVPAALLDRIGAGQASTHPSSISGPVLTADGKPEVLYLGAEYCPFCAAERWAIVSALSRFGTLSGLSAIRSAARDGAGHAEPYPSTASWTFAQARYSSSYLAFTPVEMNTNIGDKTTGGYTTLSTPTAGQRALLDTYDAAYQGAIPFVDLGNRYLSVGSSYDPGLLAGRTWAQIAASLHDPASPVARAVLGTANYLTAAICGLTGGRPASACTPAITALRARI